MFESNDQICFVYVHRTKVRLAFVTAYILLSPIPAFSSDEGLIIKAINSEETSSVKAHFGSGGRMLFIGSQKSAVSEEIGASVTFDRASDLVGTFVQMPKRSSDKRPFLAGPGALPYGMPVSTARLTSSFGTRVHPILGSLRQHQGIDLAAREGSAVTASSNGIVGSAGWNGGYGLYVALDHGGGVQTRYAHLSRINVLAGQAVRKGEVIGFVGSTGRSTGPHLHYEVRVNGQAINPASLLRGN